MMTLLNELGLWAKTNLDFPAVILLLILVLGLWVLLKTQRNPNNNFNFADMLRDDTGKPSAYRLAIFVCLAVSTWAMMYMAIATQGKLDPAIFAWYITVWSGAKVAEKGIEAYMSRNNNSNSRQSTSAPYSPPYSPYRGSTPYQQPYEDMGGLGSTPPAEYDVRTQQGPENAR